MKSWAGIARGARQSGSGHLFDGGKPLTQSFSQIVCLLELIRLLGKDGRELGVGFAFFTIIGRKRRCRSLGRYGAETFDLVVFVELLDDVGGGSAPASSHADGYPQLTGDRGALLMAKLIESFQKTVGKSIERGIVVRSAIT